MLHLNKMTSSAILSSRGKSFVSRRLFNSLSRVPAATISNTPVQQQHRAGICSRRNYGGGAAILSESPFLAPVGRSISHQHPRVGSYPSGPSLRAFSAAQPAAVDGGVPLGTVTHKLSKLNASVVQKLKDELKVVDANSDER